MIRYNLENIDRRETWKVQANYTVIFNLSDLCTASHDTEIQS